MPFFFFVLSNETSADTNPKKNFLLSANVHYGYIMSHRSNMAHLIKGHIYGGELNYVFRTSGNKYWHQLHNYPEFGLSLFHIDLVNPQQLGTWEALYPYVNLRLNKRRFKVSSNLRLGLGIAYITKAFDAKKNHKNTAIGSHLNGFVNLRYNIDYYFTPAFRLEFGAGLSHASNGSSKTPNLGLNIMTLNLGIAYVFGNKIMELKKDTLPDFKKHFTHSVYAVFGIKEMMPAGGKKYTAYGINYTLLRTLNRKNSLGAGIDLFYNNATVKQWEKNDTIITQKFGDIFQAGIKLAYSFNMHRVSLPVEFGVYTYKRQPENGIFFHRIGFRYRFTNHLIANFGLLSHFAKADYFEYGLGYQF